MSIPAPLRDALARHPRLAIAVSGGVDSMTLAHAAHAVLPAARMLHAVSPAVPAKATARVRRHAEAHGWALSLIDAGELADPRYAENPVNRCYFCKTNLYARMAEVTDDMLASGTNLDDLGDYRPGLDAAKVFRVVHPFVEVGLTKADVYAIAAELGLNDLAALPAQPCLASRIETGIHVDALTLAFVERAEAALRGAMPAAHDVRCRVTAAGIVGEAQPFPDEPTEAAAVLAAHCAREGRVFAGLRPYRRGAAFLHTRHS